MEELGWLSTAGWLTPEVSPHDPGPELLQSAVTLPGIVLKVQTIVRQNMTHEAAKILVFQLQADRIAWSININDLSRVIKSESSIDQLL